MNIRKYLDILNESEKDQPFDGRLPVGVKIMTLDQFVNQSSEEPVIEADEDKDDKFLGAQARKLPDEEMKDYLDRIVSKEKEKGEKYKLPYIHRSNVVPIVNEKGEKYDLAKLRDMFTQRPDKILKQNEKMKHSDGTASVFYNIGLPALLGLVVDEETGEFYVVNTCPGAGSCKIVCFAMAGGYVQWKASSLSQTRMLNYLLNAPDQFMQQLSLEIKEALDKNLKKKNKVYVRWHDAGDFFSPAYLAKAYALAKTLPEATFYAYTKIADVAKGSKPDNFVINFSMGAKPKEQRRVDFKKDKHSVIVPMDMFKDLVTRKEMPTGKKDREGNEKVEKKLIYKNPAAIRTLKERLAKEYDIKASSILTYDEMKKTTKGKVNQYNVIVKPGDGDIS